MNIQFLRHLLPIFLVLAFTEFGYAQKNLKISGYAPQLAEGTKIYLSPSYPRRYLEKQNREKAIFREKHFMTVRDGRFSAVLQVRNGETYLLEITGIKGARRICLAEGLLEMTLPGKNLDSMLFKGNETTMEYERYFQSYYNSELYKASSKIRVEARMKRDSSLAILAEKLLDSNAKVSRKNAIEHFKQYPNSYINTILLNSPLFSEQQRKEIFSTFPKRATENSYGDNLRFDIDSLFVGGYAPVFTQNDTAGNAVKLDSYRGKYVLLDFWASWCVPCRAENPHLVDAMKLYGKKNFNIIGISLDEDKQAWLGAIKADGLNWTHVSDLKKRYKNDVSVHYDIYSIPANFLLDPSGKIIAKNLRGKEVLEILKKVIK